jgi:hypothetical protein
MQAFAEADLRDVLPRIDVSTLLLYGDKDVRSRWPRTSTAAFPGQGFGSYPERVIWATWRRQSGHAPSSG